MMHPRIRELIDYLDRERAYLDTTLAAVSPELHNKRPSAEAWCVAQVVHHLAQSEGGMLTLLERLVAEAREKGLGPDAATAPLLPTLEVRPILDRSRKIKNPRANPSPDIATRDALTSLDTVRRSLKDLISRDDLPDLGQVVAPHPAFGPISGYQWLAFAAAHTHRHADQIREIDAALS